MNAAASIWRVRPGFLAALLLAWFFGQTISVSPELGITADEVIHLAGGYSYWTQNDYRLQPENGNLPQRWATLPLLWLRPRWSQDDDPAWRKADNWGVSHRFLFHLGNQPETLVLAGRLMVALLGVLTGLLVYGWARSLFGWRGGLVATALFAANPGLLAHSGLVTSDLAATFGFLAATLTGWRMLHRLTPGRVLVFGAALGVLALAKFSAPLFAFIFTGLLVVRLTRRAPLVVRAGAWRCRLRGWRRLPALAAGTLAAGAISYGAIWAAYGFRYATTPAGEHETKLLVSWDILLGRIPFYLGTPVPADLPQPDLVPVRPNAVRAAAAWIKDHRILPEAYVYGFLHVYTYSRWRPAFFMGEYKIVGWPTYFPVAFLVKNPLALLALYALAAVLFVRLPAYTPRPRRLWYRLAPLLVFGGIYAAFALTSRLNIGYRHLLPLEPVLCAGAGVLALALPARLHWRWALVAALWIATTWAGWQSRPAYLAFFNSLVGGSNQGYKLFVDSTVDWGQGLPRLRAWLDRHHRGEPVYLSYFGSDLPPYQGIRATRLGDQYFDREPRSVPRDLQPGHYVVSATLLQGVYTMTPGPWTAEHERVYRSLWQQAYAPDRAARSADFWLQWDQIRFGRLRHFLRQRAPDAQPDPSLLVYRLTAADLTTALYGPPPMPK
jgi:hypothetical protein